MNSIFESMMLNDGTEVRAYVPGITARRSTMPVQSRPVTSTTPRPRTKAEARRIVAQIEAETRRLQDDGRAMQLRIADALSRSTMARVRRRVNDEQRAHDLARARFSVAPKTDLQRLLQYKALRGGRLA